METSPTGHIFKSNDYEYRLATIRKAKNPTTMITKSLANPKICLETPTRNWRRVWHNKSSQKLNSAQRSYLYLLVNNKIKNRADLFHYHCITSPTCPHCPMVETLKQKFSVCHRSKPAWTVLQRLLRRSTKILRIYTFLS